MSVWVGLLVPILGIFASWFYHKEIVQFLQAYKTDRQKSEIAQATTDAQDENQKDNQESDALKKIDGR